MRVAARTPTTPERVRAALSALLAGTRPGRSDGATVYRALVGLLLRVTFVRLAEARGLAAPGDRFAPEGPRPAVVDEAVARAIAILPHENQDEDALGEVYEATLGFTAARVDGRWTLAPDGGRRRSGSHYTPRALADEMVLRTIGPLLAAGNPTPRVCDPAMGAGAFLLAAARLLSREVSNNELARREMLAKCVFGVDRDPLAARVARHSLWLFARDASLPLSFLDDNLRCGDATVGRLFADANGTRPGPALRAMEFDWTREFPGIFEVGGFDALVGNPPWVSYAGRASQPLEPALKKYYAETCPAFGRYRNLQGVFAYRAASLLRPGGRLGLILPSSMAFQDGYAPTRRAHDALCEPDDPLPFFGEDSFSGVFQPCMGLLSTRRTSGNSAAELRSRWPIEEPAGPEGERELLASMDALPRLPPALFGERGFQTSRDDVSRLTEYSSRSPAGLRCGADVQPFRALAPTYGCDPRDFAPRFRAASEWRAVRLLIRQTARWPIAALADGTPFRNSVLAGFADDTYGPGFLLAYLNSTPLRLYHYLRQRDARQGMPQLKVGHLRALPAPPRDHPTAHALAALGESLGRRNTGLSSDEQCALDDLVLELLELGPGARESVREFRELVIQKFVGRPARAQSAVPAR